MYIRNLSIKTKVLYTTGIPIIFMLFAGITIYINLEKMMISNYWVSHTHKVVGKANEILASAIDMETGMRGYLLAGKETFLEPYKSGRAAFYKLIDELTVTVSDNPKQVKRLNEIKSTMTNWLTKVTEPAIQLRREVGGDKTMDDISSLVAEARGKQYFDQFRAYMNAFTKTEQELIVKREQANKTTALNTQFILIISIALAAVAGLVTGYYFIRDLLKTLGGEPSEVNAITQEVAYGNLSIPFEHSAPKNSLYDSMRLMVEQLKNMVSDIQKTADELSVVAKQTSAVASETADAISTQVHETTQVATAINEMSATVKEVSSNVNVAAGASAEANNKAIESREVMTSTVNQMNELNAGVESAVSVIQNLEKNTNEINSIVEVIKGVAEQTNLLALNAAIEAARAGEQGRGFAVVADEVRSLAERTQKSTQEINQMIEKLQSDVEKAVTVMSSSQAKANEVSTQVSKTDETLLIIQQAIQSMNDMNTQIASTTEEQSVVVEEINHNVVRVHDMAERTSLGARQASETGQNLLALSNSLQQMMSRFKM